MFVAVDNIARYGYGYGVVGVLWYYRMQYKVHSSSFVHHALYINQMFCKRVARSCYMTACHVGSLLHLTYLT